ncbi:UNVERIFIED_CONTAM: hypothetical protein NCL1_24967 [Trichonephila clavipes]
MDKNISTPRNNCGIETKLAMQFCFSSEEVLGPMDPRDIIYTMTRLRGPSRNQSLRRLLHREKCTRTANCFIGYHPAKRESRFNLSSDDNRVGEWKSLEDRLKPAFALQRYTAPRAGVMVWGVIAYNTWSPLVLIRGTTHTHDSPKICPWQPATTYVVTHATAPRSHF